MGFGIGNGTASACFPTSTILLFLEEFALGNAAFYHGEFVEIMNIFFGML